MDKNSLIGLFLIGLILFGFTWLNSPKPEDFEQNAPVQAEQQAEVIKSTETMPADTLAPAFEIPQEPEVIDTLRNGNLTLAFSSKGARITSATLEKYQRLYEPFYGDRLMLFDKEGSDFSMSFYAGNAEVRTSEIGFKVHEKSDSSITYRYYADSVNYLEFSYVLPSDGYMVDYTIDMSHINAIMQGRTDPSIKWMVKAPQQEKGFKNENNYTTISWKYIGTEDIEELSPSTEEQSETDNAHIHWLAFKQQFFSSVFIADSSYFNGATFSYRTFDPKDDYIKEYNAKFSIPMDRSSYRSNFRFYFGPNKFSEMNCYSDIELQKVIPLGGWIIGWISRLVVIPTFDFLSRYISNYGIIILLLTILIKLLISPLTFKSYLSTAKMRVLKPEMDKISEKYPKQEDAMKKQQAVMALYKSAGVSPMGGCLPLLIQFPILWAMFRFFPTAIELRGQAFLWASDLSSYDSIWTFPGGFSLPWYGDHISLFTLLMAVSLFISSKINMATQPQNNAMPGMNFMMLYLMPAMLLLWFNDYASGLTYYYLLSNLFALGQTLAFRYLIDDKKLYAQIEANKKKPHKKSRWTEKLEKMQKQAEQQRRMANKR